MDSGNVRVSGQVNVRGNITANCFIGNGALLTNIIASGTQKIDIRGNVTGNSISVGNLLATVGNIGNTRMSGGNVDVSGQVNVRGNVVAEYFIGNGALLSNLIAVGIQNIDIRGNVDGNLANVHRIIANVGNIGNIGIEGGNVDVSGQVNVRGNVVAEYFIGNGALLTSLNASDVQVIDIRGNVDGNIANVHRIITIFGNIGNVRMLGGNINMSGQVSTLGDIIAKNFVGNGALVSELKATGTQNINILGNVVGSNVSVGNLLATVGNVGNVRMENGNLSVSGNVIAAGNIIATVGPCVASAGYVEIGKAKKRAARPFLRPAFEMNIKKLNDGSLWKELFE
jgi:cytoskeletal protein CcmA (bactofilin family)